jgi:alpha-L-fucosidase
MEKRFLTSMMFLTLAVTLFAVNIKEGGPVQTPDHGKMEWFQNAKFGLFLHWGVYSKLAGEWKGKKGYNEFVMLRARIPIKEYEEVAKTLNPEKFNADKWVLAAKNCGMRYIVITSKHHEGFAMFKSPSDPYNIVDFTNFKRDPLKELSDACKKYGVKFCVYYSLGRDWHDPDVPTNWPVKGGRSNTWDFPDEDAKVFSKYYERKVKPQVRELITQYHPAILWFDTPEMISKDESKELKEMIAGLDPQCIVNDRIGHAMGDYRTLEQKGADQIIPGYWETCMTMSSNWGYSKTDTKFKSPEKIIGLLVDAVSKGGNMLLNAGPTPEGELRPENLKIMTTIGDWLKVNGEAIYGSKPWVVYGENADSSAYQTKGDEKSVNKDEVFDGTPKNVVQDIRFTTKGQNLYVIARSWRSKTVIVKSLSKDKCKIGNIHLLGCKAPIVWKQADANLQITLPNNVSKEMPIYVFKVKLLKY